jgi:hypothetical protein
MISFTEWLQFKENTDLVRAVEADLEQPDFSNLPDGQKVFELQKKYGVSRSAAKQLLWQAGYKTQLGAGTDMDAVHPSHLDRTHRIMDPIKRIF